MRWEVLVSFFACLEAELNIHSFVPSLQMMTTICTVKALNTAECEQRERSNWPCAGNMNVEVETRCCGLLNSRNGVSLRICQTTSFPSFSQFIVDIHLILLNLIFSQ
jgi:hypothetical protein